MTYFLAVASIMVAWRFYDGRGYPYSEAAGWVIGPLLGALAFGIYAPLETMVYGALQGALATWCIVRAYKGWDQYMPMLRRSWPAVGVVLLGFLAMVLGMDVGPVFILSAVMCVIANVGQVPFRRKLHIQYTAHICEAWEAAWVGIAIAVLGMGT